MGPRSQRILFTGATSQAGRAFYLRLIQQGHDVVAVSRTPSPHIPGKTCQADLTSPDLLKQLPDEHFDALIHFASHVPLRERESTWEECVEPNIYGTAKLLNWAHGRVERILVASSVTVYGEPKLHSPVDESYPLHPDTAYAISKYGQEKLFQAFCLPRSIPLVIIRLGWVYGPGLHEDRAIMKFLRQVQQKKPITLFNSKTAGLQLIHQDDIAWVGDRLLRDGHGIYNLASTRHISLMEFVEALMRVTGQRTEVICQDDAHAPSPWHYSHQRLSTLHGILPHVTLETGIKSLLESHG